LKNFLPLSGGIPVSPGMGAPRLTTIKKIAIGPLAQLGEMADPR
jgi:hypothetical protein